MPHCIFLPLARKQAVFFLLACALFAAVIGPAPAAPSGYDAYEVDLLKKAGAVNGPGKNINWNSEDYPGSWYGVTWQNGRAWDIDVFDESLTGAMDLSGLTELNSLNVGSNQLTGLNVSGNAELQQLYADANELTSLDVSGNAELNFLVVVENKLTSLDVSGNAELQELYAATNELASLNVSGNAKLRYLAVDDNQLTSLDASGNLSLQKLSVDNNRLPLSQLAGLMHVPNLYFGTQTDVTLAAFNGNGFVPGQAYDLTSEATLRSTPSVLTVYFENGFTATEGVNYIFENGILTFLDKGSYKLYMTNTAVRNQGAYGSDLAHVYTSTLFGSGAFVWDGSFTVNDPARPLTLSLPLDNAAANATWNGTTLTKMGAGTLVLTGENTYTGGTFIQAGTLQIGNGGTTGSIANSGGVYIAGGAALAFNRSSNLSYGGAISGAGRLIKHGGGTLTLTGGNSYAGGTFINAGNLVATTANLPAGRPVSVARGASLTFNQAGKGTFSGAISGAGSLVKNGKGMLTLSGTSSHSGATKINAGGITLTGKLTKSPVTVAKNATFTAKAKGALGKALTVSKKGTLQIGNKGTLAKTTLKKGAFLQLVNNNKATTLKNALKLHKGAKVTLSGKKWKVGKTYTVLSAKKAKYLKGFTQRTIQNNRIDATLRQGTGKKAKTLQLTVTSTNKAASAAKNGNARSALAAISTLSDKSALYRGIESASASSLNSVGKQLSGQDIAKLSGNLASLSRAFAPRNLNRLSGNTVALNPRFASFAGGGEDGDGGGFAALPALAGTDSARSILSFNGLTLNAWSSHTGGDAGITSKGGAGDSAIYGPESSGGYDLRFDSGYLLGASFRSGTKAMGEHGADSSASLESYSFSMYGGKEFNTGPGVLRFLAGAATSYHDISSNRSVKVNGVKQGLSADYTARSTQFFTELAYAMPLADILVMEPFASVTLDSTKTGAFKESGGPAALYGAARTQQTTATLLGLRAHLPATERFAFTAELGWQRNHGDLEYSGKYRFAEGGEEFGVKGNKLNRDAAAVAFGVDFTPSDSFKLNLGYQGQVGARSTDQSANLNVMWEF